VGGLAGEPHEQEAVANAGFIGGSGDFARNAYLSIFVARSTVVAALAGVAADFSRAASVG
jgi:acyl-CoA hydrolase